MSAELNWNTTQNDNKNALRTGEILLAFGDVVEVQGQSNKWIVTYVKGSEHEWYAVFDGQDGLPIGVVEWRIIYKAPRATAPREIKPKLPKPEAKSPQPPVPSENQERQGRIYEIGRRIVEITIILLAVIGVILGLVMFAR